jgi:hypothetical protein
MPLCFTDSQLALVLSAGAKLHVDDRSMFLAEVVGELPAGRTVANVDVREAIAQRASRSRSNTISTARWC